MQADLANGRIACLDGHLLHVGEHVVHGAQLGIGQGHAGGHKVLIGLEHLVLRLIEVDFHAAGDRDGPFGSARVPIAARNLLLPFHGLDRLLLDRPDSGIKELVAAYAHRPLPLIERPWKEGSQKADSPFE